MLYTILRFEILLQEHRNNKMHTPCIPPSLSCFEVSISSVRGHVFLHVNGAHSNEPQYELLN